MDDIGVHFGIGGSGVYQAGRRIAAQIENDKDLAKTVKKIEDNLSRMKICPFYFCTNSPNDAGIMIGVKP